MLDKIFSVTNDKKSCHKIITILGIELKFKSEKLSLKKDLRKATTKIEKLNEKLKQSNTKINKVNARIDRLMQLLKPTLKYSRLARLQINKDLLDVQIEKFKKRGTIGVNTEEQRNPKIIVTLTTFPDRIGDVHYALYSLLNQTVKPDKVILWLGEEQFPDREEDISQQVLDLKNNGLTIEFTKDIRSYKKLVPALKQYPEDILVTADDDIYYPPTWLEQLYSEYLENPNRIYAHRVYQATLDENEELTSFCDFKKLITDESCTTLNFPTTGGGVLYPPHSLYKDAADEEIWSQLSPRSDENWFWSMVVMNRKEVKVVKDAINMISKINVLRDCCFGNEITLARVNQETTTEFNTKDQQIRNIMEHYPQMIEILRDANKKLKETTLVEEETVVVEEK